MTWLVAGLGNPGEEHAKTRHNVGAMVVDLLVGRCGERFRKLRFIPVEQADVKEGPEKVILARSTQFMNVSGPGFAGLAKKMHLSAHQVIAVHDEIDLPFGRLQVKRGGSTAGHHGLDSLVEGFRSPDYFLEPFSKKEQPAVGVLVEDAADAVLMLIRDGLNATQEHFNRGLRR